MRNRKHIIMSVGMLLTVDTKPLISSMAERAKQDNPKFNFRSVQKDVFALANKFNRGQLEPEEFAKQMLKLLTITSISPRKFLVEWNKVVDTSSLKTNIELLQAESANNQMLFYLISDTNAAHFKQILRSAKKQGVGINRKQKPNRIAGMPFYPSFQYNSVRHGLIENTVNDLLDKKVPAGAIAVLYGDPGKIAHPAHRVVAEREYKVIKQWCDLRGIAVILHGDDLQETMRHLSGAEAYVASQSKLLM